MPPAKPAVLPADTVANVNKVPISKADVALRLQELKALVESAGGKWIPPSAGQMKDVVDEMVNTELMSQDAVARGLDRSLEVQQRWEYLRRGFFAREWLRTTQEQTHVAPADIEQYYEQNKQGLRVYARIKLRELVTDSEDQANRALTQLHGGAVDFETLAKQISVGPTASMGGLLSGRVMRSNEQAASYASQAEASADGTMSLDPVLEAAAFAIDEISHVSNYVKGADNRYHIFQLVERQAEHQRDKSEVWDQIKNYLEAQKLQAAVDGLRGKATLEQFPERLEGVSSK